MAIFAFILGTLCGLGAALVGMLFFDLGLWWAVLLFYITTYAVGFFPLLRSPAYPARRFSRQHLGRHRLKRAQTS
ncbi:hypothetical protein PEL8287_03052 [Roseovarius litorisediminis]|uniref:Uncharacterized protein n=1 Tax=Roseovarius litorisediminis TaxID=1312363 RepID=A0A1Y5T668_9RHOB|nr:hypothetical protein [Roseovarius litorisediminis]SLN56676.1 hypothetical protein PEL8287_03052 [Roseovarius litorisediminis]